MRQRPMHLRRAMAVFLGLALTASACQSDGDDATAGRGGSADDVSADERPEDQDQGPLSALLGRDLDQDAMEDEFQAERRAVEDLIVACMADEGFTYEPGASDLTPRGPWHDLPPDEFAAEYGFGLTTVDQADQPRPEDANEAIVAGMTKSEQDAWNLALHGATRDADGTLDFATQDAGSGGCVGTAARQVWGEGGDFDQSPWVSLIDEINGIYEAVRRDPRVAAAAEEWAACLSDAGHPGYSLDGEGAPSVHEAVMERFETLTPDRDAGDEGEAAVRQDVSGALVGPDPSQYDPDELAEVRGFEIELAVAELPCRQAYDRVEREVGIEYEQTFVDANRAELEAYRDAMAEAESGAA